MTPGYTLPEALAAVVAQLGDAPAYSDKVGVGEQGWRTLTWRELSEQTLDCAAGLIAGGLAAGDRVAIMASARNEHVVADLGAVHAGGVPISIYDTFAPDQIAAVVAHAEPTVAILQGVEQLARWADAGVLGASSVSRVIVMDPLADPAVGTFTDLLAEGAAARAADPGRVHERVAAIRPDDPATILYTSGSTGAPKGVLISHTNLWFAAVGAEEAEITPGPKTIAYLPYAHITERLLGLYIPQTTGGHSHQVGPEQVFDALREVRPVMFFGVPRIWEKLVSAVAARVSALSASERAEVEEAMAAGLAYVEGQQTGNELTAAVEAAYAVADAAWLNRLRADVGIENLLWAGSGGAPLSLAVSRYLAGLGIPLYNLYGMTETTASISSSGPGNFRIGSVGRPPEGNEVKIAADGEILVRGPAVTAGYFRAAGATEELFDADGWLRTGDIGHVDEDGFIFITDRKKELIVTSTGKNVAPSNVEALLKRHPVISQALVYGDDRPYLVALLTLDPLAVSGLSSARLEAAAQEAVAAANAHLSRPEQVRRYRVLPAEWSPATDELTATLKLRRRVIHRKFSEEIDALYA